MATNSNTARQRSPGPSSSASRSSTFSAVRRRPRCSPPISRSPTTNRRARSSTPKSPVPTERSRPSSASSSCSEDSDNTCAICLSKPSNRCFTDACFHPFCYSCLLEWSKVKPTCPLCQKPFGTIIHNIKDDRDFERYHIFQQYDRSSTPRHSATERGRIYESYQYARVNGFTRYRVISPEFFFNNPAQRHRLIPWLNRELLAVLQPGHNMQVVMELILMMICSVEIEGPEMRQFLDLYLSPHTQHFQHEFYCFASSPHDMPAFDRSVQYEYRPPLSWGEAHERLRQSFTHSAPNAADLRDEEPTSAPLRSQRPEFSAFRPWSHQPRPNVQPSTNSPQPSTSGAQLSGASNPGPSNPRPTVTLIIDSSSDDEDCQIVKVIKPARERVPILIDLCDSESEQDTLPAQTPPPDRERDVQEDGSHTSTNRPRSMIGAYYPGPTVKTYDSDESTEEDEAQNETTKPPRRKNVLTANQRDSYAKRPRK